MKFLRFLLVTSIFSLAACTDSELPDSYRLDRFRVLALHADAPEVSPGDTVMVTPFISDIDGGGRAITYSADACVDPGVGFGAEPTCVGSPTRVEIIAGGSVTGLTAPNYTGEVTSSISVTIPPTEIIFADRSPNDQFNGVNYLVRFDFTFPDGSSYSAFRQILVSTRSPKNQNPTYGPNPILSEGAPLTALPPVNAYVNADVLASSNESYEEISQDGATETKTEQIETSWFISDGDLAQIITDDSVATLYTSPTTIPSGHNVMIVIVTRDQRGGVTTHVLPL